MAWPIIALLLALPRGADAAAAAARSRDGEDVSPMQKVLSMMDDMLAKGKSEKQAEQVAFATYKMFCQMTRAEKAKSIAAAKEKIEQLNAAISTAESDAATAAKEITALDADVATWEGEKNEASAAREKAHSDYLGTHAEYEASIESVSKAMMTMQASSEPVAQSLIQLSDQLSVRTFVPAADRQKMQSFMQQAATTRRARAPEANAFESSSGGVVEMVEGLGKKFKDELKDIEKAETEENNNHQLLLQDLIDQIDDGKRASEKKKTVKTSAEQTKAEAEGDLVDTEAGLKEDEQSNKDLGLECARNSEDYEQRQVARAGEITAITKAIEIMSNIKSASLYQQGANGTDVTGVVLAQLRSQSGTTATQSLVARFLADRARSSNSRVLSLISAKATSEPFKKVAKMIKDMIVKLMEEANEEAEHKGFCDTEMGQNKVTRDLKTQDVASLKADIEELSAKVVKLSEEVSEFGAQISEIGAALVKATTERGEEKAKNTATIEDARIGGEAVAKALAVLKEYYEKASLLQDDSSEPEVSYNTQAQALVDSDTSFVQAPYSGQASGGIIGMLDVIESDFARLGAETAADEAVAEKAFKTFKGDSDLDTAVKTTDMNHKTTAKTDTETKLANAKSDMKTTTEELNAALQYFEKLKPSCVDAGVSYEDRVARRKEEIESLKEALQILSE